ncbi:MAG: hypothetical protein AAF557_03735 [Pseudomonadota bacterium]
MDDNGLSGWSLRLDGLHRGTIRGTLTSASGASEPPEVEICVNGEVVGRADIQTGPSGFKVSAPLPAEALGDGVTTVVFRLVNDKSVLGRYPVLAGSALDGDIVADVARLKAEVEALKAAFLAEAHTPKLRAVERDLIVAEAVESALAAGAGAPSGEDDA